ncbi:MAG: helix-turn-helix domain-containing protein [Chloroflexi bacterium]|nr:MAG: helix-turn-helix domain-containing protein [Chloroflexota bacterium]
MSDLALALLDQLDESALALLAERLAPHLERTLEARGSSDDWLDAHAAADYLGITRTALHKLTAARAISFEQEGPGCKLWFRRSSLDAWRQAGGARSHLLVSG